MKKNTAIITILALICFALAGSACVLNAPAGRASISDDDATQIAEASLIALNEGDYEAFVANFADELRQAMSEENFQELRTTLQETSGMFLSLTGPQLVKASTPDVVGYVYTCKFEKEEVILTNYYQVGGDRVEGYFVNSPNLRGISQ